MLTMVVTGYRELWFNSAEGAEKQFPYLRKVTVTQGYIGF